MKILLIGLALSLVVACDKAQENPQTPEADPVPTKAVEHAPADAKAGSHEDWCGEHAVPESLCTRCNSSLIPAFKASGDWCPEHGLPESQCLLCNPELKIEWPPKEET